MKIITFLFIDLMYILMEKNGNDSAQNLMPHKMVMNWLVHRLKMLFTH